MLLALFSSSYSSSWEVNSALFALEHEVRLFERARDDSWEAVSQRVSALVDDSVGALSEGLTDLRTHRAPYLVPGVANPD